MATLRYAGIRVLVIDDDESIRSTLVDMLEFNEFHVTQATQGEQGFTLAARDVPDIILTDVAMPAMDGFELIRRLRADERTRAIPVIIISASVDLGRMRRGMELGAEDYLVKPFTLDQVLRSISARLERKALLDEVDAFAHTVAHDLKNPIAVLKGRTALLRSMWSSPDEAKKLKQLDEIEAGAKGLESIVEELLLLASVWRQMVPAGPLTMNMVVKEALMRVSNLAKAAGVKPVVPNEWPAAVGYGPWVVEVWTNYLSNALKYGGNPPKVELGATPIPERRSVRFWVQDHGPGLGEAEQAKLFAPFSRLNHSRADGHGLGLSIVRRIIERLDGQVGVDSAPGKGCRFWFELPSETKPD